MATVTYNHHDGTQTVQQAAAGDSVMETAVKNGVPGIVGECGGALICSTCHVYVDDDCIDATGSVGELEDEMLDGVASDRMPNSRLSCQLSPEALGDLQVRTPERQY